MSASWSMGRGVAKGITRTNSDPLFLLLFLWPKRGHIAASGHKGDWERCSLSFGQPFVQLKVRVLLQQKTWWADAG